MENITVAEARSIVQKAYLRIGVLRAYRNEQEASALLWEIYVIQRAILSGNYDDMSRVARTLESQLPDDEVPMTGTGLRGEPLVGTLSHKQANAGSNPAPAPNPQFCGT